MSQHTAHKSQSNTSHVRSPSYVIRSHSLLAFCFLLCAFGGLPIIGCATPSAPQLLFKTDTRGMLASDPQSQQAGNFWAEGWASTDRTHTTITVNIHNRGAEGLPLSYIADQYLAQTSTGNTVALEKGDFFNYPDLLKPGEECSVTLRLPQGTSIETVTALIAKLNGDRVVLTIPSIHPAPPSPPTGNVTSVPATEPVPGTPTIPATKSDSTAAAAPSNGAGTTSILPTPSLVLPQPTVPVTLAFFQEFGTALQLHVTWDNSTKPNVLQPSERQTFLVAPGPHVCHLRSSLGFTSETMADVPLVVQEHTPMRLIARAHVQFSGVQLIVRVWRGSALILQDTFAPGSHEPIQP